MLKNVVLPAPLGPMSDTIDPRGMSKSTLLTAVRPPNFFVTPRDRTSIMAGALLPVSMVGMDDVVAGVAAVTGVSEGDVMSVVTGLGPHRWSRGRVHRGRSRPGRAERCLRCRLRSASPWQLPRQRDR